MEVDPIQKIKNSLIQGRETVIEKNNSRILNPHHIKMINQDITEEIDSLLKVVDALNVLLVGRYQSGKTTLFNLLTGQNRDVGTGVIPCSKEMSNFSHKTLQNVVIHDTPGTGDEDISEEKIQEMLSKTLSDVLVLVLDGVRAVDITIQKEHQKLVNDISAVYKKQTGGDMVVAVVLTKLENFDEESKELKEIKTKLKSHMPNAELIIKKSMNDISGLDDFLKIVSTKINNISRILSSLHIIRTRCCHAIIWRNAGKLALYSIIPGLDIAMYIILSETVDLLLCALYGKDIRSITTGIPTIINVVTLIGRGIFVSANILAKLAELSVIFFAVGTAISAITNSTGLVVSGYLTLSRLNELASEDEVSNFNNEIQDRIEYNNEKYWKRIKFLSPDSIICFQSGDKWLHLKNKFMDRSAFTPNQATRFKVEKLEGKNGYIFVPISNQGELMKDKLLFEDWQGWARIRKRNKFIALWEFIVPKGKDEDYQDVLLTKKRDKIKFMYIHNNWLCVKDYVDSEHRFVVWQLFDK